VIVGSNAAERPRSKRAATIIGTAQGKNTTTRRSDRRNAQVRHAYTPGVLKLKFE
jgi:hypothetical protein